MELKENLSRLYNFFSSQNDILQLKNIIPVQHK